MTPEDHEAAFRELLTALDAACAAPGAIERQCDALLAVIEFLDAAGVEARLQRPLLEIAVDYANAGRRYHSGGAAKSVTDVARYTKAAAAVTVRNERGERVKDALETVGRMAGIEAGRLKNYRYEITQGRASRGALVLYQRLVEKMRTKI